MTDQEKEARREAYAEKVERRRDRYEVKAEKAAAKSEAAYGASSRAVAGIPMGQPILVGHHSERRHRAALARSDRQMRKTIDENNKAAHYRGKAAGVGKGGVSSDDPDAVDKLREKLTQMEAVRAEYKAQNRRARKEGKAPHPSYMLTNLGGNIHRVKARIAELAKAEAEPDRADVAGEGFTVEQDKDDNRLRLYFDERPSKEHCRLLKQHGFRWAPSVTAWQRQLNNGARYNAQMVLKAMFGAEIKL